jgi:hypothetical protein
MTHSADLVKLAGELGGKLLKSTLRSTWRDVETRGLVDFCKNATIQLADRNEKLERLCKSLFTVTRVEPQELGESIVHFGDKVMGAKEASAIFESAENFRNFLRRVAGSEADDLTKQELNSFLTEVRRSTSLELAHVREEMLRETEVLARDVSINDIDKIALAKNDSELEKAVNDSKSAKLKSRLEQLKSLVMKGGKKAVLVGVGIWVVIELKNTLQKTLDDYKEAASGCFKTYKANNDKVITCKATKYCIGNLVLPPNLVGKVTACTQNQYGKDQASNCNNAKKLQGSDYCSECCDMLKIALDDASKKEDATYDCVQVSNLEALVNITSNVVTDVNDKLKDLASGWWHSLFPNSNIKKILPWVLGIAAAGGGLFIYARFFRNKRPASNNSLPTNKRVVRQVRQY